MADSGHVGQKSVKLGELETDGWNVGCARNPSESIFLYFPVIRPCCASGGAVTPTGGKIYKITTY